MFHAFRQPPHRYKYMHVDLEKTARNLLETRKQLIPWLDALINHIDMQQTGLLASKATGAVLGGTGFALLFTPAFPVGIGLGIASGVTSLSSSAVDWSMNKGNARMMQQRLKEEMYLADKFQVGIEITKARSAMIRDQLGVDDKTSMFIAAFSSDEGAAVVMSEALKYVLAVENIYGVASVGETINAANAVQLASQTWATMMAAATVVNGVAFGFCILDLLTTFYLGNPKKKEAVQIRDRVNNSLSMLSSFVTAYDNMHMLEANIKK